jgi:hypothetical protein
MYREIVTPTKKGNLIKIPKEYWNQKVEILVLPLNEISKKVEKKKKDLKDLLNIGTIDIEEVRVSDWNIAKF